MWEEGELGLLLKEVSTSHINDFDPHGFLSGSRNSDNLEEVYPDDGSNVIFLNSKRKYIHANGADPLIPEEGRGRAQDEDPGEDFIDLRELVMDKEDEIDTKKARTTISFLQEKVRKKIMLSVVS